MKTKAMMEAGDVKKKREERLQVWQKFEKTSGNKGLINPSLPEWTKWSISRHDVVVDSSVHRWREP
jgi:hypothetical protein